MVLDQTGRRLLVAYLRAVALAEPQRELASRYGISLGDWHAVRLLARMGPSPISKYGDELGVPRSTITNLVDRLERAGLVERLPGPTDRRVTLVQLAPAGRKAVEETSPFKESEIGVRLLALDPAAQSALADLLERVVSTTSETQEPNESEANT